MPTPDTEALDARLRAVERALTESDTTLERATAAVDGKSRANVPDDEVETDRDRDEGKETAGERGPRERNGEEERGKRAQEHGTGAAAQGTQAAARRGRKEGSGDDESGREGTPVPEPVVESVGSPADPDATEDAPTQNGDPDRSPPARADLERRLLDLEAAVQALRRCLEREPREDRSEGPATDADAPGPDPDSARGPAVRDGWPDDLAADGGRSASDGPNSG